MSSVLQQNVCIGLQIADDIANAVTEDDSPVDEEENETCKDGVLPSGDLTTELPTEIENEATVAGKTKCSQKLATRIHRQILRTYLPQLHKTLTQKVIFQS